MKRWSMVVLMAMCLVSPIATQAASPLNSTVTTKKNGQIRTGETLTWTVKVGKDAPKVNGFVDYFYPRSLTIAALPRACYRTASPEWVRCLVKPGDMLAFKLTLPKNATTKGSLALKAVLGDRNKVYAEVNHTLKVKR